MFGIPLVLGFPTLLSELGLRSDLPLLDHCLIVFENNQAMNWNKRDGAGIEFSV